MSSGTWTPAELSSNLISLKGECWRLVEAQHIVSTMKLTDTTEEQDILEELIEKTKPKIPAACKGLSYLFSAAFRYSPYPDSSRFRRTGSVEGVYYAAENVDTAVAEMAFYRVLFFAESPKTPWPANPTEYSAFSAAYATTKAVDLTTSPMNAQANTWKHLTDYAPCQDLADAARAASADVIRYSSVRDPRNGNALALLECSVFTNANPVKMQTWRIHLSEAGVRAKCEFPSLSLDFDQAAFAADPRLAGMVWKR